MSPPTNESKAFLITDQSQDRILTEMMAGEKRVISWSHLAILISGGDIGDICECLTTHNVRIKS